METEIEKTDVEKMDMEKIEKAVEKFLLIDAKFCNQDVYLSDKAMKSLWCICTKDIERDEATDRYLEWLERNLSAFAGLLAMRYVDFQKIHEAFYV